MKALTKSSNFNIRFLPELLQQYLQKVLLTFEKPKTHYFWNYPRTMQRTGAQIKAKYLKNFGTQKYPLLEKIPFKTTPHTSIHKQTNQLTHMEATVT